MIFSTPAARTMSQILRVRKLRDIRILSHQFEVVSECAFPGQPLAIAAVSLEEIAQVYLIISHVYLRFDSAFRPPAGRQRPTAFADQPLARLGRNSKPFPRGESNLRAHSVRGLGGHSVYALAGAQSEVIVRLLVARLDARSTSMKLKAKHLSNKLELNDLSSASIFWQQYSTTRKGLSLTEFFVLVPSSQTSRFPNNAPVQSSTFRCLLDARRTEARDLNINASPSLPI